MSEGEKEKPQQQKAAADAYDRRRYVMPGATREGLYRRMNVRGFLVDFFGALVPGILFIFLSFLALVYPTYIFLKVLYMVIDPTAVIDTTGMFYEIVRLDTALSIELCVLLLVGSYVVGSMYFRMDPKKPDFHSYMQSSRGSSEKERAGSVVQVRGDETPDVQFPYRYLKEYLNIRGLEHLARMVRWSGEDKVTHIKRSKTFINTLKIRLEFYFPASCGTITKNEAHVRLASSLWYILRRMKFISGAGLTLAVASVAISKLFLHQVSFDLLVSFALGAFVLVNSILGMRKIQKAFHYQRVREIVYVLETAYIAAKEKPQILEGLVSEDYESATPRPESPSPEQDAPSPVPPPMKYSWWQRLFGGA